MLLLLLYLPGSGHCECLRSYKLVYSRVPVYVRDEFMLQSSIRRKCHPLSVFFGKAPHGATGVNLVLPTSKTKQDAHLEQSWSFIVSLHFLVHKNAFYLPWESGDTHTANNLTDLNQAKLSRDQRQTSVHYYLLRNI